MFRFLFVFFSILFSNNSFSQWYTVAFDINDDTLIKIDTTNPANIWEIGKPQKTFFDSAFTNPNTIVTDTINSYPSNNFSSFILKIPSIMIFCDVMILFNHKYDTDSLLDGGYVEITFNGGNTWKNIVNDPNVYEYLYSMNDTIEGGIHALSGKSNWKNGSILICGSAMSPSDTILLRFNFLSDSSQNNKEGWMIDDLALWCMADACGMFVHELNKNKLVTVFPNPFANNSILEFKNQNDEMNEVIIYNFIGEKISKHKNISNNQIELTKNNFSKGLYFYQIKTKNGYIESGKFVVQ